DVGEVQLWVDALGVEVQRQGHQADVAGALAVTEQATFDAIGAGHDGQFRSGDAGAAVVVGVHADQHAVALVHVATEPFHLVGIVVRRGALDGSRQVEDQRVRRGRLEHVDHCVAHLDGEVGLGAAEHFGRVLEAPLGFRRGFGQALDGPAGGDGNGFDAGLVLVEDDLAEARRAGVVVVDDGTLGALERFEGALDEVVTGLGQYLDVHVIRNMAAFDQFADEVEIGLRSGGEAHIDFLQAYGDQALEGAHLLLGVHRLDQRLVAVTQVGGQPDRCLVDDLVRPGAIRNLNLSEGAVLLRWVFEHGHGENPRVQTPWSGRTNRQSTVAGWPQEFSPAVAG